MRIWFDRLRLLRSSPASPTRRWLVRRGNQWLWCLLRSSTYREAPPFRHKAILIILQSITPGMTRIMHRAGIGVTHGAGVGVTHGAGDGRSEFPSDLADAGTAGSAAAFSVQTSDASALVTLASSIRGSDAPALCMRVLVAVSVTAWAGVSTAAAGTANPPMSDIAAQTGLYLWTSLCSASLRAKNARKQSLPSCSTSLASSWTASSTPDLTLIFWSRLWSDPLGITAGCELGVRNSAIRDMIV